MHKKWSTQSDFNFSEYETLKPSNSSNMVLNLSNNNITDTPTYLHNTHNNATTTTNNHNHNHHHHHDNNLPQQYGASQKREDSNVRVTLQNKEMWTKFHHVGTEMIITKAGR